MCAGFKQSRVFIISLQAVNIISGTAVFIDHIERNVAVFRRIFCSNCNNVTVHSDRNARIVVPVVNLLQMFAFESNVHSVRNSGCFTVIREHCVDFNFLVDSRFGYLTGFSVFAYINIIGIFIVYRPSD